jgi:large repetitive protein
MGSIAILFTLLITASAALPGQGIITTMAGVQFASCGPLGDGGPATSAQLCGAQSPAVDASGNIYFFDYGNARIRKIAPDGTITTIAGTGVHGSSGDGGPALNATLGGISQMAVDPSGQHLCFGDAQAYKIRCITLGTGIITGYGTGTPGYAGDGGNVANATFYDLQGAAFDDQGNFYVSDFATNNVRRVDAITGIVTTFAGPGPGYCCAPLGDGGPAAGANLYEPEGLAYHNGVLYISDEGNDRVRSVNLATGVINTVAGNGSPYDSGDGGPAVSAGLLPRWLAVDGLGNLFIDVGTAVRMVDTSGIITTIAGTPGTSGWGSDDIPATQTVTGGIDGLGWDPIATRLLISDTGDRIRQIFYTPPTTTALSVSPNPAFPGQQATLQATVSPSDATGSVRFYQGSSLLGSATLSNAVATFPWTSSAGSYPLHAVYGGDPTHNLSISATVTLTIQKGNTTTALASNLNPSVQGQTVTFTATVTPSDATEGVLFYNGATLLGTSALSGGVATFTTSTLPTGSNSITARYAGNGQYNGSTSSTLTQVVEVATTTALTSTPNPSTFGSPVTLTATVTPAAATGSVQFFNGSALLGTVNLTSGKAQLTVANLPAGTASLTANYGGDAGNAASTSSTTPQTVNKANSTTTISASPASQSTSGQTVTFTAKVAPLASTGVVQFLDGSTVIGSGTLNNGTAVFSTTSLAIGNHSIKASYGGDGNVNGSQSGALSYRVKH